MYSVGNIGTCNKGDWQKTSTYISCVCASFYATLHDCVTNCFSSGAFVLLHFVWIFLPCLYACSPLFPHLNVMQRILLGDFFYSFERGASDSSLFQSMHTHYGAHRASRCTPCWERGMNPTIYLHLQLRLAQAQACTWTVLF
jgi:hypothetical protein